MKEINKRAVFISLLLSIILWVIFTLNSEFEKDYSFKINYENLPKNKASILKIPDFVVAKLKGKGWDFVTYNRKNIIREIELDYLTDIDLAFENVVLEKTIQSKIKSEIPDYFKISNLTPNKILLVFKEKLTKKIPVIVSKKIQFSENYELISDFVFSPDSIEITGVKSEIEKIKSWKTDSLILTDLNKSTKGKIELANTFQSTFQFSDSIVIYGLEIDRYTEKNITTEVKIINNFSDKNILLLPKTVNLKFTIPISEYDNITENDIDVVADFKSNAKNGIVNLTVIKKPLLLKNLSIYPSAIEYIKYE